VNLDTTTPVGKALLRRPKFQADEVGCVLLISPGFNPSAKKMGAKLPLCPTAVGSSVKRPDLPYKLYGSDRAGHYIRQV
jgi:hypothetical protein